MQRCACRQVIHLILLIGVTFLLSCNDSLSYRDVEPAEPIVGPKLSISESVFDFGQVPQNSTVSARFYLKSTGDDTLRITQVTRPCGCVYSQLEAERVAPRDSVLLEIFLNTKYFKGPLVKQIKIYSNADYAGGYQAVKIRADVTASLHLISPVQCAPYKIDISQFGEQPRYEVEFHLLNVSQQRVRLRELIYPHDLFELTVPQTIPGSHEELSLQEYANGSFYVTGLLRLTEKGLASGFESSITIEANDSTGSRLTIPVRRRMR